MLRKTVFFSITHRNTRLELSILHGIKHEVPDESHIPQTLRRSVRLCLAVTRQPLAPCLMCDTRRISIDGL